MKRWFIALGSLSFIILFTAQAEMAKPSPPEAVSPNLEITKGARGTYRLGEIISYQIKLHWPRPTDDIRMSAPDLVMTNLELDGISQETVSQPGTADQKGKVIQLLTFNFKAQKPGPAKVERILLRWTQSDGWVTSSLAIPSFEVNIKAAEPPWLAIWISSSAVAVFAAILSMIFLKRKTEKIEKAPVQSSEEIALDQLRKLRAKGQSDASRKDSLEQLAEIVHDYLGQKLNWRPNQGGYNTLQKIANELWSPNEASLLTELLRTLEEERFSGVETEPKKFLTLYDRIYSLIEKRRAL